ncbi:MAG: RNA polymerase sigma factor [Candidatus Poribacteria bacterium]
MGDSARAPEIAAELIAACQRGDQQAFRTPFEAHQALAFRLAYRFVRNADEAADLTQDIFLRVLERIGTFRCECAFSTWLYRLARNACLNHIRRLRASAAYAHMEPWAGRDDPAKEAVLEEMTEQVVTAVDLLPDSLRAAFILVVMEDFTYRETADALTVSVEAVHEWSPWMGQEKRSSSPKDQS